MNLNKNFMLMVAIIGIGIFVLPSTLSMFAGQHTWYDPDGGIPCEKCHFIEEQELVGSGGPHDPDGYTKYNSSMTYSVWTGETSTSSRCLGCHQSATEYNNNTQHAAIAVLCTDCHSWVISELQAEGAAHTSFYDAMNVTGDDSLRKSNKACIGCHTMVGVNTTWVRAAYVAYNVSVDDTGAYTVQWNTTDGFGTNASLSGSNLTSGYT